MTTFGEKADIYEPPTTKNIADLPKISIDWEVSEKVFKEGETDEFKVNVVTVDGEDYRIPNSVLEGVKFQRKENPNLKYFKVRKDGEGMKTKYTVIPLTETLE
jgi:hypothetical protein